MKRKLTLLFTVLLLSFLVMLPAARAQLDDLQEIVNIKLPNYALGTPVQVSVTYTYTQQYGFFKNITTLTQPLYEIMLAPTGMTFHTNEVDVYTIPLYVRYDAWVNQTITITLFEKNETGKVIEVGMFSKGFNLELTISAYEPPPIIDVDAVSENIWNRFKNEIQALMAHEQRMTGVMNDTQLFTIGLAAVSFGGFIAILLLLARVMKKQATLEAMSEKGKGGL